MRRPTIWPTTNPSPATNAAAIWPRGWRVRSVCAVASQPIRLFLPCAIAPRAFIFLSNFWMNWSRSDMDLDQAATDSPAPLPPSPISITIVILCIGCGLVCIRIFGYSDPHAEKLAEETGIAFQLTNILRDVAEDASRNRVYLPLEDLAATVSRSMRCCTARLACAYN